MTETVKPITDALLDQLQDEMRDMASGLRAEARNLLEEDDRNANEHLADELEHIAGFRPLLVRFAFTLRQNHTRHSAICALTGGVT